MDREIYSLKVYSTRMEYDAFQLELGPEENEAENDYFGMQFNVTLWCRGELCAKLWGKLYDENRVYGSAMDILNVADPNEPEETAGMNRCPVHPLKRRPWFSTEFTDYAADLKYFYENVKPGKCRVQTFMNRGQVDFRFIK